MELCRQCEGGFSVFLRNRAPVGRDEERCLSGLPAFACKRLFERVFDTWGQAGLVAEGRQHRQVRLCGFLGQNAAHEIAIGHEKRIEKRRTERFDGGVERPWCGKGRAADPDTRHSGVHIGGKLGQCGFLGVGLGGASVRDDQDAWVSGLCLPRR